MNDWKHANAMLSLGDIPYKKTHCQQRMRGKTAVCAPCGQGSSRYQPPSDDVFVTALDASDVTVSTHQGNRKKISSY